MKKIWEVMKPVLINAGKVAAVVLAEGFAKAVTQAVNEDNKITTASGFTVNENQTSVWEEK